MNDIETDGLADELAQESMEDSIVAMKQRKTDATKASVGDTVPCSYCSTPFVKRTYQQCFCKSGKCKDRYHNTVNETRRIRSTMYN